MADLFPRAGSTKLGYKVEDVDAYFGRARYVYEQPGAAEELADFDVRRASFGLQRGGYQTPAVDSALDRLEVAFTARIKERYIAEHGQDAWMQNLASRAQSLYPRLRRPAGERFAKPGAMRGGYSAADVDQLLDRMTAFFDQGKPLTADEVRAASFKRRSSWRAYDEKVVDAYLARAVDILLGAA
ncbi:DivIVA domain-containing protein [Demequina sp.]|uniref:DivIVA domain-containing protein n=1 Tax=Demequina sp. TaxID=2050685 RepID=UPI003A886902